MKWNGGAQTTDRLSANSAIRSLFHVESGHVAWTLLRVTD